MRIPIVRLIAAVTAALLPVVLLPAPSQAATFTIISRSGTSAGSPAVQMTSYDCTFPFSSAPTGTYAVNRAVGPGNPPLGTGSLQIIQRSAGLVSGVGFEGRSLSTLAAFSGHFRSDLAVPVFAALRVIANDGSVWHGTAKVANLAEDHWQAVNALAATYTWVEQTPGDRVAFRTPAGFKNVYGSRTTKGTLAAGECDAFTSTTVYVDNFRVSKGGGDTQVFNFEPRLATSASISATRRTITNGGSTTFTTVLRSGSKELAGRKMVLLAKRFDAAGFTQVGSAVTTNSDGVARKTVSPTRNTTYDWYFKGDTNYRPVASQLMSVGVRARVSLTLADSTLRPGQTLVANGRVTPAKVGSVATLWRKTSSGRVKLGSVTLSETDGTFRITKVLSGRGTYKVYVTVPAAKGNLGGTSSIRTATVS